MLDFIVKTMKTIGYLAWAIVVALIAWILALAILKVIAYLLARAYKFVSVWIAYFRTPRVSIVR